MSEYPQNSLTAIILAGGRGRRMGMQNKGLLAFRGQALVAHVIARLRPQVSRIIISANEALASYREFGFPVIPDQASGYAGPLAGIHAVMHAETDEWYITAPCDTPFLPMDYVSRMMAARQGQLACVAHDGKREQSGCCLLHHSLLPALNQSLRRQHYAVYRWLKEMDAGLVDFSDEIEAFTNLNTPDDLRQLSIPSDVAK